jgi:hypothetical protein
MQLFDAFQHNSLISRRCGKRHVDKKQIPIEYFAVYSEAREGPKRNQKPLKRWSEPPYRITER